MNPNGMHGETTADTSHEGPAAAPRPVGLTRFQLGKLLGEGGMGRVFAAYDPGLKREVAVKLLKTPGAAARRRFAEEARLQARVDHPHICKVYEVGEEGGTAYIAMQRLHGAPLTEVAHDLDRDQKLLLVARVAQAIHEAHRAGLIHRDLKPGNILVEGVAEGRPRPCVLDFGIARVVEDAHLTQTGAILGTPHYMAPEQALGRDDPDARCDVFALGAILYHLLTGAPPHGDKPPARILADLMQERPVDLHPPPGMPADLLTICRKAMAPDRDQRYATARALAEDLHRFLDHEPISARAPSRAYRLGRWVRKHRAVVVTALAGLLLLAGASGGMAWHAARREAMVAAFSAGLERLGARHRHIMMARPHDTRAGVAALREEMTLIRETRARMGAMAEGPALEALGQAHLRLGEAEEAHALLARAWSAGRHTPQTAFALGLALTELYERAARRETILAGLDARPPELDPLLETYRDKALGFLAFCRGAAFAESNLLEARTAYASGAYADTLALLADRTAEAWLYERDLLEGKALARLAASAEYRKTHDATALYARARAALDRACAGGKSDSRIYRERAALALQQLDLTNVADAAVQTLTREGLADVALALEVNPDDEEARWVGLSFRLSDLRRRLDRAETVGLDEALAEATAQARQLTRNDLSRGILARLHLRRAQLAINQKQDPAVHLDAALAEAEAVADADRDPVFLKTLGLIYMHRAKYVTHDPDDENRAIAVLQAVLRQKPDEFTAVNTLGMLFLWRAERLEGAAQDAAYGEAATHLDHAADLNPDHYLSLYYLGRIYEAMGKSAKHRGDDPHALLAKAAAYYTRGMHLKTNELHFVFGRASVHSVAAYAAHASGRDPAPDLAAAYADYQRARELAPQVHLVFQNWSIACYLEAVHAFDMGRDARAPLRRTLDLLDQAEALAPGPTLSFLRAQALLLGLRDAWARGEAVGTRPDRLEALLHDLVTAQPPLADAWMLMGGLRLLQAVHAPDPAAAEAAFAAAHEAYAQAPDEPETRLAHARLCAYEARARSGAARTAALAQGDALAARALSAQPNDSRAQALAAVLHLLRDPKDRTAARSLQAALDRHPGLVREWAMFAPH